MNKYTALMNIGANLSNLKHNQYLQQLAEDFLKHDEELLTFVSKVLSERTEDYYKRIREMVEELKNDS